MWGGVVGHPRFDELDSTNRYLLDEARAGAPGLVAVADHQTAGRGRLDRRWEGPGRGQPAGLGPPAADLARPRSSTSAPVAVALAAAGLPAGGRGGAGAQVAQRPLVGERKLAGILAEADSPGPNLSAVVVGIGINVAGRVRPGGAGRRPAWTTPVGPPCGGAEPAP
jgi:BirA family biotin operon repressor/biotin-[acetyl-CoA-carboxylase] ligase